MDGVPLPPDLESFAAQAVAAGRYPDVEAVVAAGIDLLRQQEAARADLLASVLAAQEDADREGYLTGEDLLARIEARLARRTSPAA